MDFFRCSSIIRFNLLIRVRASSRHTNYVRTSNTSKRETRAKSINRRDDDDVEDVTRESKEKRTAPRTRARALVPKGNLRQLRGNYGQVCERVVTPGQPFDMDMRGQLSHCIQYCHLFLQ